MALTEEERADYSYRQNWTLEPWVWRNGILVSNHPRAYLETTCRSVIIDSSCMFGFTLLEPDMIRIAACVSACRYIPTETLYDPSLRLVVIGKED